VLHRREYTDSATAMQTSDTSWAHGNVTRTTERRRSGANMWSRVHCGKDPAHRRQEGRPTMIETPSPSSSTLPGGTGMGCPGVNS
jgi:hypothetical protein